MIFRQMDIDQAEGAIIAHTVRLPGNILKKGTILSAGDIASLLQAGIKSVTAVRLQADDLGENEAAMAVAEALAGDNLVPGKWH
jgi:molybdenum cofactor cytidylyltransferase